MKNLPTILILALAFIHGVNAGKISGTLNSTEDDPMAPMPKPDDQANGPMDRENVADSTQIAVNEQMDSPNALMIRELELEDKRFPAMSYLSFMDGGKTTYFS